ncbi:hypothetical protein ACFX13_034966 [Malus domestica]
MGENLSLADSYALVEKHSLWDEAKQSQKLHEQLHKDVESTQNKARDKLLNNKDKPGNRNKLWFKMPQPMKGDTSKMN